MIDEADSLGYMEEIQKGYGYLAGFNIIIWTFWQDKGQLDKLYGASASTFIGSSRAVQAFGGLDETTLDFIGKKLGKRLIQESINPLNNKPDTQPLREHDEIEREISKDIGQCYILRQGKHPMLLGRVDYFKSSYWFELASPDPDYPNNKTPFLLRIKNKCRELLKEFIRHSILVRVTKNIWRKYEGLLTLAWVIVWSIFFITIIISGAYHIVKEIIGNISK